MGREVRRVPANWQHPKNEKGKYAPLYDGKDYERRVREWDEGAAKWAEGLRDDFNGGWMPIGTDVDSTTYVEWDGERPAAEDYMPNWPASERTHCMMYEDTSEGTPISPAFATPEELARWLADTGASAFGPFTADYDHWLRVANGRRAPSMIVQGGRIESGVQGFDEKE
jgi:hypothetical protein